MRDALVALAAYAATFCAVFLWQLGNPRAYATRAERATVWFLAANGASDLTTNVVVLLVLVGALHGRAGAWGLLCALVVEGAFYTWRVWLGRKVPRPSRRRSKREVQTRP